jgi:hypothetical protein
MSTGTKLTASKQRGKTTGVSIAKRPKATFDTCSTRRLTICLVAGQRGALEKSFGGCRWSMAAATQHAGAITALPRLRLVVSARIGRARFRYGSCQTPGKSWPGLLISASAFLHHCPPEAEVPIQRGRTINLVPDCLRV